MSFSIETANVVFTAEKTGSKRRKGNSEGRGMRVTVQKNGRNPDGTARTCNCLAIFSKTMKDMRLMHGDQVRIQKVTQNEKEWLAVIRVTDGTGYKLGGAKGSDTGYSKFAYSFGNDGGLPFPDGCYVDESTIEFFDKGAAGVIENEQS